MNNLEQTMSKLEYLNDVYKQQLIETLELGQQKKAIDRRLETIGRVGETYWTAICILEKAKTKSGIEKVNYLRDNADAIAAAV